MGTAAILSEVVQSIICVLCLCSSLHTLSAARRIRDNFRESGQNGEGEIFTKQLVGSKAVHVFGQAIGLTLKTAQFLWGMAVAPRILWRFEFLGWGITLMCVVFAVGAWHTMRLFR